MEHTKEPWFCRDGDQFQHDIIVTTDDRLFRGVAPICEIESDFTGPVGDEQKANARRIVACVNALAGVPTEWLEGFTLSNIDNVVQENARLKQQRDELLAACNTFHEWLTREEAGFCKAGRDRSTPEGEAAWREWYDENLRLCSLAHEQVRAAIARAEGK